jgi:hypothetical protein
VARHRDRCSGRRPLAPASPYCSLSGRVALPGSHAGGDARGRVGLPVGHLTRVDDVRPSDGAYLACALASHLQSAHPILVAFALPLRPIQGVVLLCAMSAGLMSALGSVLLHAEDGTTRLYPAAGTASPFRPPGVRLHRDRDAIGRPPRRVICCRRCHHPVVRTTCAHPNWQAATGKAGRLSPTFALSAAIMIGVTAIALSFGAGAEGRPERQQGAQHQRGNPPPVSRSPRIWWSSR